MTCGGNACKQSNMNCSMPHAPESALVVVMSQVLVAVVQFHVVSVNFFASLILLRHTELGNFRVKLGTSIRKNQTSRHIDLDERKH